VADLEPAARARLALLGALEGETFTLRGAAALDAGAAALGPGGAPSGEARAWAAAAPAEVGRAHGTEPGRERDGAALGRVAAELGALVRHSLLAPLAAGPEAARAAPGASGTERGEVSGYRLHPIVRAYAFGELGKVDRAAAGRVRANLRAYALGYAERHRDHVAALERERDLLAAVVGQAWEDGDHAAVVRLVVALGPIVGRLEGHARRARLLGWAVESSRRLEDREREARFLVRLGTLWYDHGATERARQTWEAALAIAEALRRPGELWGPLAHLALLACVEGDRVGAQRHLEALRRHDREADNPATIAAALLNRGVYAQLEGDTEQALADLEACARLLALRDAAHRPLQDGMVEMAAQAQVARVQGDYARAGHHTEIAVALAAEYADPSTLCDLLLEQARFARAQRREAEARALAERAAEVAARAEAHRSRADAIALLRRLPAGAAARATRG
jgi:hypothetical protein